jgi:hypothetical protein
VAGEAEVDEPLPVNHLCHLFENFDAPGVVLDQVVVGGKDTDNRSLSRNPRKVERKRADHLKAQIALGNATLRAINGALELIVSHPVIEVLWQHSIFIGANDPTLLDRPKWSDA